MGEMYIENQWRTFYKKKNQQFLELFNGCFIDNKQNPKLKDISLHLHENGTLQIGIQQDYVDLFKRSSKNNYEEIRLVVLKILKDFMQDNKEDNNEFPFYLLDISSGKFEKLKWKRLPYTSEEEIDRINENFFSLLNKKINNKHNDLYITLDSAFCSMKKGLYLNLKLKRFVTRTPIFNADGFCFINKEDCLAKILYQILKDSPNETPFSIGNKYSHEIEKIISSSYLIETLPKTIIDITSHLRQEELPIFWCEGRKTYEQVSKDSLINQFNEYYY